MLDLRFLAKYLLEGAAVAAAAYYIPRRRVDLQEVLMIALTAAAIFAVLDYFAPAVAAGTRQGAGFGIGMQMVGGAVEGYESPAAVTQAPEVSAEAALQAQSSQGQQVEGFEDGTPEGFEGFSAKF